MIISNLTLKEKIILWIAGGGRPLSDGEQKFSISPSFTKFPNGLCKHYWEIYQ